METIMSFRTAMIAACAGGLVLAAANSALAVLDPIPGVDVIVKQHPAGIAVTVGNCQSGGGKVVKMNGQWVCTGLPASKSGSAMKKNSGGKVQPADAPVNTSRSNIARPDPCPGKSSC
jgi:hypothetical protein